MGVLDFHKSGADMTAACGRVQGATEEAWANPNPDPDPNPNPM